MQIYLHVSWWCLVLRPFLQPFFSNSSWRWANTQLSHQWMGKEKVQDISCMPETNCINIFWAWKECYSSCPVSRSFIFMTDLCSVRPLLSLMPIVWFIATLISTTHLHPPQYILTSCPTAWPPTGSTESQKEQRGRQTPPNKIQMEFHMRCLGPTKLILLLYRKKQKRGRTHIFHNKELTHCSDKVCWVITIFCWSSDSSHWLRWRAFK